MSVGLVAFPPPRSPAPTRRPPRGVDRGSERKADTGTVAPFALAPPVDSDAVPVLKHIASTGAQLLSSAERMG